MKRSATEASLSHFNRVPSSPQTISMLHSDIIHIISNPSYTLPQSPRFSFSGATLTKNDYEQSPFDKKWKEVVFNCNEIISCSSKALTNSNISQEEFETAKNSALNISELISVLYEHRNYFANVTPMIPKQQYSQLVDPFPNLLPPSKRESLFLLPLLNSLSLLFVFKKVLKTLRQPTLLHFLLFKKTKASGVLIYQ